MSEVSEEEKSATTFKPKPRLYIVIKAKLDVTQLSVDGQGQEVIGPVEFFDRNVHDITTDAAQAVDMMEELNRNTNTLYTIVSQGLEITV